MTTGAAGHRNQATGLATAVGGRIVEKTIALRWPWRLFPGHLCPSPLRGLDPDFDVPAPPWPDLLITCGRRATAVSIAIRHAARGRTLTVHVQNPQCRLDAFDLIIAMRHDRIVGSNVIAVDTALHPITTDRLAEGAKVWAARFAGLPRQRLGVLVGGPTSGQPLNAAIAEQLVKAIELFHAKTGGGVLLSPSRRTPPAVKRLVADRLAAEPWAYVWDETGDNPYLGILAYADGFVVTSDSVSMISEALSTGRPVATFALGGHRRHEQFMNHLRTAGAGLPFAGSFPTKPTRDFRDANRIAAERVIALLKDQLGM